MKIGVAGLGLRGRALGARLRSTGHRVVGYDRDLPLAARSGFHTVGSADRLAQDCEIELVAADGEEAAELLDELIGIDATGSLVAVAVCGALEPRRLKRAAVAAAPRGIALVDAPVDGDADAIQGGRAVIFAGGTLAAIETCRPMFESLGRLVHVGAAGSGQIARTVNDLLRWANVLAIHDAFSLARACGADPSPIRDAVLQASGSNRALQEWDRTGIEAARQDIQAALVLADESGARMPFLTQLDELLKHLDQEQMRGLFNLGIVDLGAAVHD